MKTAYAELPTIRQLRFIRDISAATGEPFRGATKRDASEYIDRNIGEFERIRRIEDELHGIEIESANSDWGCRDE